MLTSLNFLLLRISGGALVFAFNFLCPLLAIQVLALQAKKQILETVSFFGTHRLSCLPVRRRRTR